MKISLLPAGTTPTGIEVIPAVQGGQTVSLTVAQIASGGYAAGVAAWLLAPTSANLRTAMTDETGTGSLVFGTSPAFTTSIGVTGSGVGTFDAVSSTNTLIDSPSWGKAFARIGLSTTATGDQFGLAINLNVTGSSGASADYEKFAILAWAQTADNSASHNLDVGGIDARGFIANNIALGRAWGGYCRAEIRSGGTGNGKLAGLEVHVVNNGTSQASVATTTSKYGIHLVSDGSQPNTAAIYLDGVSSNPWHKGVYADQTFIAVGGNFLELANWFIVDRSGNISSNSITTPLAITTATTVAGLPSAAAVKGARMFVTDSNAASYTAGIGAIVAAGGTTNVPVSSDGTNWRIG